MAIETKCQTNGAMFHTQIQDEKVSVNVALPFPLNLTEEQAKLLEANLHNAVELALAPHFVPCFTHDCTACIFLGHYNYEAPLVDGSEWTTVDLYYCDTAIMGGTCIARYGSDGPQYSSCPVDLIKRDLVTLMENGGRVATSTPAIVEAYNRYMKYQEENQNQ